MFLNIKKGCEHPLLIEENTLVELDTTDPAEMIPVVSAMSQMENGVPAIPEQVRQGWELFMKHKP